MAQLKDLLVSGPSRFIGDIFFNRLIKQNGTSDQILMADGSLALLSELNTNIGAKVNRNGDTMTGLLKTVFKDAVAIGSYESKQTTIGDLINEVRYSNGCMGSVNLLSPYSWNSNTITIAAGWYNFLYVPHRFGVGFTNPTNGDNHKYGTLVLMGMMVANAHYRIQLQSENIVEVRHITESLNANYGNATYDKIGVIDANNVLYHRSKNEFIKDLKLSQVYNYKGTVTWDQLKNNITSAKVGDVYFISGTDGANKTGQSWACIQPVEAASGNNYASYWQSLGNYVDLSGYVTKDTDQTISGYKIFSNGLEVSKVENNGSAFYAKNDGTGYFSNDVKIGGHIFAYNYGKDGNNAPSIVFDKSGGNYTGIGSIGVNDTIYFGAVSSSDFAWVLDYQQKWRFNGEIQALGANAFRMVQGDYGVLLRQDGSNTYFLATAKNDQYGSWNDLRPLYFNNSTGNVTMGHNVFIGGDTLTLKQANFIYNTSDKCIDVTFN